MYSCVHGEVATSLCVTGLVEVAGEEVLTFEVVAEAYLALSMNDMMVTRYRR